MTTTTQTRRRTASRQPTRAAASARRPDVIPTSSGIFSVTVLGDVEDVLACVRTTLLLGKSFGMSIAIETVADPLLYAEPGNNVARDSMDKALRTVRASLITARSSIPSQGFAVEVSATFASFLTIGAISLRIFLADPLPRTLSNPR